MPEISEHQHRYELDEFDLAVADPSSTDTKKVHADRGWQSLYERDMASDEASGLAAHFGRGTSSNPLQAEGYVGARFVNDSGKTANTKVKGKVRVAQRTPTGELITVLWEDSLGAVDLFSGTPHSGTKKDRGDRQAFPNQHDDYIGSPYQITIDVKPTNTVVVDDAEAETAISAEGYQAKRTN